MDQRYQKIMHNGPYEERRRIYGHVRNYPVRLVQELIEKQTITIQEFEEFSQLPQMHHPVSDPARLIGE